MAGASAGVYALIGNTTYLTNKSNSLQAIEIILRTIRSKFAVTLYNLYNLINNFILIWKIVYIFGRYYKTRITTFIKTKFKISDDQTNVDKYRLAANITEYHIISK